MSVTISDILKLPSMHHAEVIAGEGGLNRILSSVSVLETVNPELIDSRVNKDNDIGGSEIVITSFINTLDDEEVQYKNVCQLAASGEAGLIIYYLGVFLKEVSQRIIDFANENDFVIIAMPRNQANLRYSDAISDIMGAIINDRDHNESLVVTLLDIIARLPINKRNAHTMIKLLSERLHSTVVLMDELFDVIYEAAWPGEYTGVSSHIAKERIPKEGSCICGITEDSEEYIQRKSIQTETGRAELLFITLGFPLEEAVINSSAEVLRISLNIWNDNNHDSAIAELVKAILNDEPLKMRSLAALFHIDIESINAMWIFKHAELDVEKAKALSEYTRIYCKTSFADMYKENIVLFTSSFNTHQDITAVYDFAKEILPANFASVLFTNLNSTSEVQSSFLLYEKETEDILKVLPKRTYYLGSDLIFIKECRNIVETGEENIKNILSVFTPISRMRNTTDMIETLSTFLLDANQNISETACQMFVHKNTIKYRIKTISDCLGYQVGSMPASYSLYKAVGVKRLLEV